MLLSIALDYDMPTIRKFKRHLPNLTAKLSLKL